METRYEEEGLKERTREIEKSIIKRFRKEIWRPFVKALNEYEMIQKAIRSQSVFPAERIPCSLPSACRRS